MRGVVLLILMMLMVSGISGAVDSIQTDWSGGSGLIGPVTDWTDRYDSVTDAATLSIPGQVALSSVPFESPIHHLLSDAWANPFSLETVDIDFDGDTDVIGTAEDSQKILLWLNNGTNPVTFTETIVDESFANGTEINAGDIDGDGRLDLLGAAWNGGKLRWWRNEGGNPINWTQYSVDENYLRALWVRTGDLDGDGDLEVLGVSSEFSSFDWWEIGEFKPAGVIYSSILNTGFDPELGAMSWTTFEPAGTSVIFSVRSSNDEFNLGEWIPLTSPADTFTEVGQYVQYRAELATSDPAVSPIIHNVAGTWLTSSGIEDDSPVNPSQSPEHSADATHFRIQTPARNQAQLTFDLPVGSQTRLSVFDLSGRLMKTVVDREFASGHHEVSIDDLSSGIYLCCLQTDAAVSVQRLVVVE